MFGLSVDTLMGPGYGHTDNGHIVGMLGKSLRRVLLKDKINILSSEESFSSEN